MFAVLRQRNFALLWFGQFISMTGDWVLFITLPFYVYQLTGSALATGGMFIMQSLPRILFGSLAGVFVDRWNRRWTMIVSDFSRAAILLLLLLIHTSGLLWIIYVVGVLETTISLFFSPARSALVPLLVGEEHLTEANGLDTISDNLARLIGPSLGGILLTWLGAMASVALADSFSYVFSGLMILLVRIPATTVIAEQPAQSAHKTFKENWLAVSNEWLEGLRIVRNERIIRGIFVIIGLVMLADSPLTVMLVPFVRDTLHGQAEVLGWLMTFRGLGGLIGGFITGRLNKLLQPVYLMTLGLIVAGALILVLVDFPNTLLALILIAIVGIFAMFIIINTTTILQSNVSDSHRGRIFGTFDTTTALISVLAMAIASAAGGKVGPVPILNVSSILYIIAGIVTPFMLSGAIIKPATITTSINNGETVNSD